MAARLASPGPARWCPRPSAVTPDASCAGRTPNCPAESCPGANAVSPAGCAPRGGVGRAPGARAELWVSPAAPAVRVSPPLSSDRKRPGGRCSAQPSVQRGAGRSTRRCSMPGWKWGLVCWGSAEQRRPPVPHTGCDPTGPRRLCGPPAPFRAGGCSRVPFWGAGGATVARAGPCAGPGAGSGRTPRKPAHRSWHEPPEAPVTRVAPGCAARGGAAAASKEVTSAGTWAQLRCWPPPSPLGTAGNACADLACSPRGGPCHDSTA